MAALAARPPCIRDGCGWVVLTFVVQGGTLGYRPYAFISMTHSSILFLSVILPVAGHMAAIDQTGIVPLVSADSAPLSPLEVRAPASLSLGDVLARTAALNPELLTLGLGNQAADGRVAQAGMGPNPNLSLSVENFGGTKLARGTEVMEVTVQASQLIERGDKSSRRVALA